MISATPIRLTRSTWIDRTVPRSNARPGMRRSGVAAPPMGWTTVRAWAEPWRSRAASRWGHGDNSRNSNRSWRQRSRSAISFRTCASRRSRQVRHVMSATLPGTTAAFADANIYARATGYIARRNVDIGDRVKAGDLLAELAVPELDDQISQNEATLAQLEASLQQAEANRQACAGDLGPRPAAGPRRLGDPAAGRHRSSKP